jgi:O-succinylbenzoate synthase
MPYGMRKRSRKNFRYGKLLGGARSEIACGVSIGIQDSVEQLLDKIQTELSAGYRRIKIKVKPGWDVNVMEKIRSRWSDITLSCDANSAYSLDQTEHLRSFDQFNLLMIEQPLWDDDIFYHARLQKELKTAICLDESIVSARTAAIALETGACRIINIKVGRVGGFSEAKKNPRHLSFPQNSGVVRGNARIRHWAGAQHCAFDAGEF